MCGSQGQFRERQSCLTNSCLNNEWFQISRSGRSHVSAVHEMKILMQENRQRGNEGATPAFRNPECGGHGLIIPYRSTHDPGQSELEIHRPVFQRPNGEERIFIVRKPRLVAVPSRRGSEVDQVPIPEIEFDRSAPLSGSGTSGGRASRWWLLTNREADYLHIRY